jgi:hypothetical protein
MQGPPPGGVLAQGLCNLKIALLPGESTPALRLTHRSSLFSANEIFTQLHNCDHVLLRDGLDFRLGKGREVGRLHSPHLCPELGTATIKQRRHPQRDQPSSRSLRETRAEEQVSGSGQSRGPAREPTPTVRNSWAPRKRAIFYMRDTVPS